MTANIKLEVDFDAIFAEVVAFATESHEGQFRQNFDKNGIKVPYIVHPKAVAEGAEVIARAGVVKVDLSVIDKYEVDSYFFVVKASAILHDVVEDTKRTLADIEAFLTNLKLEKKIVDAIVNTVKLLTKTKDTVSYFKYLEDIKGDIFATIVKVADLNDNLKDLPDGKLKDKYILAFYYLSH